MTPSVETDVTSSDNESKSPRQRGSFDAE